MCSQIFDPEWIKYYTLKNALYQALTLKNSMLDRVTTKNERIQITMQDDAPKLVIHTLCGEPIFYYFGSKNEAQQLKNFDSITTLQGDAIVPQDIQSCPNCKQRIRIDQIQVAVHEQHVINTIVIDDPDLIIDEKKRAIEQKLSQLMKENKKVDKIDYPSQSFFWQHPDDPDGIRKGEPEKGE